MANDTDRDKLLALTGIISGDKALAAAGQSLLEDVQKRENVKAARKSSIGNGFILDSATGTVSRDPGYANYEAERDAQELERRKQLQQDMLERLGVAADIRARQPHWSLQQSEGGVVPVQGNPNAPGGVQAAPTVPFTQRMTPEDRRNLADAERLAREASDLMSEFDRVHGVVSSPKDIATSLVDHVPFVGDGFARVTQEKLYSPAQLSVKTRGARYEQNLSNLANGLALTGYEIAQRNKWSPFATGISQAESKRRLENIERDFGNRRNAIVDSYKPQGVAAAAAPTAPAAPPRKRIRVDAEGNTIGQ